MSLEQWNNTFNANLTSTFLIVRAFLRQVEKLSEEEKEKVSIILIGSTAGKYGEAGELRSHFIQLLYWANDRGSL